MSDTTLPPAGFYPDPNQAGRERWWNGEAWEEFTRVSPPGSPTTPAPSTDAPGGLAGMAASLERYAAEAAAAERAYVPTVKDAMRTGWFLLFFGIAFCSVPMFILLSVVSSMFAAGFEPIMLAPLAFLMIFLGVGGYNIFKGARILIVRGTTWFAGNPKIAADRAKPVRMGSVRINHRPSYY